MREIKFRVWDKITQSYSGGDLWSLFQSGKLYYGNALWKEGIVELFTGLYDKNGKEIYEGDIISVVHPFKNRKHNTNLILRGLVLVITIIQAKRLAKERNIWKLSATFTIIQSC